MGFGRTEAAANLSKLFSIATQTEFPAEVDKNIKILYFIGNSEILMPWSEEGVMRRYPLVFGLAFFMVTSGLWAGGWNNTLIGARAMAVGGAFVGLADDPSAIFHNPAGIVFQNENFNFSVDGFYIWPTHDFTTDMGINAQSKFNSALPQIFFTYRMNERITLGFGAYVPYAGGGVDWKRKDLGVPLKSYLAVISLTPTISYQVSENLSVGINLNYYRGILDVETESESFGPLSTEEKGSSITAGFGLMYWPSERIGIGLSLRGPTTMNLSGKTSITSIVPGLGSLKLNLDSETRFKLPWDLELGLSYRIADNLVFTASAQRTFWSALDEVEKTIKDIPQMGDYTVKEPYEFEDILILHGGVEYIIPGGIALRGGIGFDRYASPDKNLRPTNIDVDKFSLIGGIGYRTGSTQIDFVFIHAQGKEREKTTTPYGFPIVERYNLSADIIGMGVTFSF
jgi:long-chain fatty acid transport protein